MNLVEIKEKFRERTDEKIIFILVLCSKLLDERDDWQLILLTIAIFLLFQMMQMKFLTHNTPVLCRIKESQESDLAKQCKSLPRPLFAPITYLDFGFTQFLVP